MNEQNVMQELEPSVVILGSVYGLSLISLIVFLMPCWRAICLCVIIRRMMETKRKVKEKRTTSPPPNNTAKPRTKNRTRWATINIDTIRMRSNARNTARYISEYPVIIRARPRPTKLA